MGLIRWVISIEQYFFERLMWKMDELPPPFVNFNTSNVDIELKCVVVKF